jgi:hypothetical protein
VALVRLSESRGGTPTGEPRPKRIRVATSGCVARNRKTQMRLSAFRFPFSSLRAKRSNPVGRSDIEPVNEFYGSAWIASSLRSSQ